MNRVPRPTAQLPIEAGNAGDPSDKMAVVFVRPPVQ